MFVRALFGLVLCVVCAAGAPHHDGRVVNGTDTTITENPFVVSLRGKSGSHSCGASILTNEWILTAAHCIGSKNPSDYTIQYGSTIIAKDGNNIATVAQLVVHEAYDPNNQFINDIAVLRLSEPLQFDGSAQPITLPTANVATPGGSSARLIGWGLNATGGIIQTHLQKVDLKVVGEPECRQLHNDRIHSTNLCAGVPEGGQGQCSGDSGGPLTVNGAQVGIVSWSVKPCTIAPYPGVFTQVAFFVDWIRTNTGV